MWPTRRMRRCRQRLGILIEAMENPLEMEVVCRKTHYFDGGLPKPSIKYWICCFFIFPMGNRLLTESRGIFDVFFWGGP